MTDQNINIRHANDNDWGQIWPLLHDVFQKGDSYPFPPETSEDDARQIWMKAPLATYIAEQDGIILGTYYLKPNQAGLGNHICNAGYIVSEQARGRKIAQNMCLHSLSEAKRLEFLAMQFNYVVSTNIRAVQLWQHMGFQIIGTVPKAFRHKDLGLVDAYVMYQDLEKVPAS